MNAIETTNLNRRFKDVQAIDDVSIALEPDRIHGLLGRNGAGKTTLMKLLTGQVFADSGSMRVLGGNPVENPAVLSRTTFIQESQKYPDGFRPLDILRLAADLYPNWDQGFADQLIAEFRLPTKRAITKISRGQLSAVGIIVGLAARSPVTFFDEPYLGLDVVARQLFFDRLLLDFAEHPRTVVLSTHHIDEASNLLERVVLLDEGRVLLDAETEDLAHATIEVSGRADEVEAFTAGYRVLKTTRLGALATAVVDNRDGTAVPAARDVGLDTAPVSLQQLIVNLTTANGTSVAANH